MVVGVMAHLLEVIVLSAHPNTFLSIGGTLPGFAIVFQGILFSQKDRLKLVHTRIRKKQGWIIFGYNGGAVDNGVILFSKEIKKILANLSGTLFRHYCRLTLLNFMKP